MTSDDGETTTTPSPTNSSTSEVDVDTDHEIQTKNANAKQGQAVIDHGTGGTVDLCGLVLPFDSLGQTIAGMGQHCLSNAPAMADTSTNQLEDLGGEPSADHTKATESPDNNDAATAEVGSPNVSNHNNNNSLKVVATRTRSETMESTNIDSINETGSYSATGNESPVPSPQKSPETDQSQQQTPSTAKRYVKRVNKWWIKVTEKLRGAMLKAVVETSVTAATYPRTTIVLVIAISIGMTVLGYYTNFTVRLDNETIFTPTTSELVEFNKYLGNFSMYERVEPSRRRKLRQARALEKLRKDRRLVTTFNILNDDGETGESITELVTVNATTIHGFNLTDEMAMDILPVEPTIEDVEGISANVEEEEPYYERGKGNIFPFLIHADTTNIFTMEGIHKMFDVLDFIKTIPGYAEACRGLEWSFHNAYGENTCEIRSITRFWNHNRTLFEDQIKTEEDLFDAADEIFYPDGGYVDLPFVLAEMEEDEQGRPFKGQAFYAWIFFKDTTSAYRPMTDNLLKLQAEWKENRNHEYLLEFTSAHSFAEEVERAILGDLPLIPTVFVVMCLFTCLVFFKFHKVHSRSLLGVGAVVTVLMSVLSGYGLLFTFGVPMTVMTNLLIFVVFGVGLDDTFIITGAYFRTNHQADAVERVRDTMECVGSSILATTCTTMTAFALGTSSTILPIRWLCLYAFPTILIDFLYQITLFVSILVLDEQRIQQNRMDCCICYTVPTNDDNNADDFNDAPPQLSPRGGHTMHEHSTSFKEPETKKRQEEDKNLAPNRSEHVADRFMRWFASRLLRHPAVKATVVLCFAIFAAVCVYSASKLRQQFQFKDLLPTDSYVADYVTAVEHYSDRAVGVRVVFRFVDQADEEVRNQMEQFVEDLVANVDALNEAPPLFWAREFRTAVAAEPALQGLPFYEQLNLLLQNPTINDAVGRDIRFRDDGTILNSEVMVYVTDLDWDDVRDQITLLQQQREVTKKQPVNKGKELWSFFTYDLLFHIFAFYEVAPTELATTTVMSVSAVCGIAFLLIPHWSAVPIILPFISLLYIEMMGVLQMFGYSINVVTYVVLVVSIGLLVDFLMHMLFAYYEADFPSREEKVRDALGTMGASILVGGLSTFLGVTPLIFSASEIFSTVCFAFLVMVGLGITHGLILLPVVLSYIGTEQVIQQHKSFSQLQTTAPLSGRFPGSNSGPQERELTV